MHEIEIRCLPADMVETITVDVSSLEVDEALHISQVVLPEGVQAMAEGDTVVFQVRIPRVVETADEEETEGEGEEGKAKGGEE